MSIKVSTAQILGGKPEKYDGFWASVSKVKTFDTCPAKYQYSYIQKLPKKTWDFHTFGKFLHKVLEDFHLERLDGNTGPDNVLMAQCFKGGIKEYETLTTEQKDDAFEICTQYLSRLASKRADKSLPEIVSVEEDFWVDIDGKVLLRGFIDRVQRDPDGILHVADYKTSKSSRYLKKDDFQLLTYAYVKCVQDPSIKKIRTSYIMLKLDFEYVTFEFERDEVMKIAERFLEYADRIQSESLFRPETSPLCGWCDYREFCEDGEKFWQEYENKKKKRSRKRSKSWGATSW